MKITIHMLRELAEYGYETPDERRATLQDVETYPTPYSTNDIGEMVRWAEFCRALQVGDFAEGDILCLNEQLFLVIDESEPY